MSRAGVALSDAITWVGAVDWTVRDFHSFATPRGATYNAYLVADEQPALIDTVKAGFAPQLLAHIRERLPLESVRYVVCNHAEPDHAGALPAVLAALPNAEVVCNAKCKDTLARYADISAWRFRIVRSGDTLCLGKQTLSFLDTPMLHWPESMATFAREDGVLFCMDAFGQHLATSERFDDECAPELVQSEAKAYYANILMPFGRGVLGLLDKLAPLAPRLLATSHGLIWRGHVAEILAAYRAWASATPSAKVVVAYDTMWGATEQIAQAIADGAAKTGAAVRVFALRDSALSDIATEVLDAAAVAIGSATLNAAPMPMVAALLSYLKGLRPQGKVGFAFGSYGWGRGGPEGIDEALREMKLEPLGEPLRVAYRADQEALARCHAAGVLLGERALAAARATPN